MTAANLRRLKDEKRKIWLSRSSCSGAEISIWAVATMLWTVPRGRQGAKIIKKETHEKVMRLSKKRKMFDYEIVEEALQEYFNKNS